MGEPTDDDIIRAMTTHGSRAMTYVIRNVLWTNGFRRETPWILRQLKRMERAGRVRRVPTSYAVQICWAVAKDHPTHG